MKYYHIRISSIITINRHFKEKNKGYFTKYCNFCSCKFPDVKLSAIQRYDCAFS